MNLTLSLGISNNGGTTRKRKLWDGVDDVGDGSSGGDRGRVIMRLLHAREERMTARQETDDEPRAAACSYTDDDAAGGIRLMRLLLSSAAASKAGDARAAAAALHEVYRRASFRGGDPAQRVAAYFADALASSSRILIRSPAPTTPPPTTERPFLAYTMFYQASPLYQLAHFTANQAIVEAFEAGAAARRRRLHVVDFDVAYGFQWPSLIQSLSDAAAATTSTSGSGSSSDGSCDEPVSLRITGLGASADELRRTESRLTRFASGCPNLRFEFEGIVVDNGAIRDGIINIKTDDDATVVVNLVFPDARNASREECGTLLARVRSLNPALVVLVEKHDSSGNARSTTSSVLPRFTASLRYFAAVFDSLHECLPADSAERLAIERNHLGTEISSAALRYTTSAVMTTTMVAWLIHGRR
ncbi:hypothetical protein PR202_ga20307 [Eleusine coracana subsp. coracana]|uniref:DELLA protein n=1 Tax=Eleusine coracana subsp. coracana TaxID=191504 RepID=A0AAV5CXV0_ELECO|nr:hypothetical protein PR202_ga20307 [Eleusine coracana subsp. coracana]